MKELRMLKKYPLATAGCCTAFCALLYGCGSGGNVERVSCVQDAGVRSSSYAVSGNMLLAASREAAQDALTNPAFNLFLEQYKKKSNGRSPLLKLGPIRNDTDDCDLQTSLVSTEIADTLFRAGKLRVAGGVSHSKDVGTAKQPDSSTENKSETTPLLLTGMLMSNRDKSDKTIYDATVLSVQITDMETGENIWRFSTSFGTKRTKALIGK